MAIDIGIIQITSKLDPEENLAKISKMTAQAKKEKPELKAIFLPECFYSFSNGRERTKYLIQEEQQEKDLAPLLNLAKKYQLAILGGSAATFSKKDNKVYNRCFNISSEGKLLDIYDKIHLFKCYSPCGATFNETSIYDPGSTPKILNVGPLKIGLSICFDLRFPHLYQYYAKQGINCLSVSSAFTKKSGKDHWHVLLRARAIETQSYVIASNQFGIHNDRMESFGHSLFIDPWGRILSEIKEGEGLIFGEIDLDYVDNIRKQIIIPRS